MRSWVSSYKVSWLWTYINLPLHLSSPLYLQINHSKQIPKVKTAQITAKCIHTQILQIKIFMATLQWLLSFSFSTSWLPVSNLLLNISYSDLQTRGSLFSSDRRSIFKNWQTRFWLTQLDPSAGAVVKLV